jgi:SAM-dependent methyltransferase
MTGSDAQTGTWWNIAPMISIAMPHLPDLLRIKYGPPETMGPAPRLRQRFGYVNPDDWYEATLFELVKPSTVWLDVGCGHSVFPFNRPAAKLLGKRCRLLVGLDPSDNISKNEIVHERAQCLLEDFETSHRFDLITMRMVAEHVSDPEAAVAALARLAAPGAMVVIYTVAKWAPVTILSAVTPFRFHQLVKRVLWNTDDKDTFPTVYRMNTRTELQRLFHNSGFSEEGFHYLDDCRAFGRFMALSRMELAVWKTLRSVGLRYPEACIIGLFRKNG